MADDINDMTGDAGGDEDIPINPQAFMPPPFVSFNEVQVPEVVSWEVGQVYEIKILVKQVALFKPEIGPRIADFEIVGAKAENTMTQEQLELVRQMT